jgi:hypothetical protein
VPATDVRAFEIPHEKVPSVREREGCACGGPVVGLPPTQMSKGGRRQRLMERSLGANQSLRSNECAAFVTLKLAMAGTRA